jgi:hypothetical protein
MSSAHSLSTGGKSETWLGRVQHALSPGKEKERAEGSRVKLDDAPIGIPADPEPHDPPVGKDRPKEVKDEKEMGHRPRDEAVEFGRSTARLGWRRWRERSQGRRWRCGLVFVAPPRLLVSDHDDEFSLSDLNTAGMGPHHCGRR